MRLFHKCLLYHNQSAPVKRQMKFFPPPIFRGGKSSVLFGLPEIIGVVPVKLFLPGREIKPDGAAGVHGVAGVEVVLQGPEHAVFLLAHIALQPGGEHLADAVVVADGRAGALDRVQNGGVVGTEGLLVLHPCEEDEVQVRTLGVAVG